MQNQQPNYNALLNYILNPGGNTARTAQDILKGTGLQGTYNTQVGVGNAATQAGQKVTDAALAGPVNGSYVNAAPMQDSQNQAMIKDSSMPVNLLLGILSQATSSTNNAANAATSLTNNAINYGPNATNAQANKLNSQVNAGNSGWYLDANGNVINSPSGGNSISTGNPRIDAQVYGVMNGQVPLSQVPADIKPRVLQQLAKVGYDVAKPINTDVADMMGLYGTQGNSLASANNPGQSSKNILGDLLSAISGNHIQTATEQRLQQYNASMNNFKKKYASVLGNNIDLPSPNDTEEVAQNKFTKLMKQIRAVYYNGGSGPSNRPSLDSFNQ